MTVAVSPLTERFLNFPGMMPEHVLAFHNHERIRDLRQRQVITTYVTALGELYSLGPAGRTEIGLPAEYQIPTLLLEDSAYLHGVVLDFERHGFTYEGRRNRTLHRMTRGLEVVYLTGTCRGVRVRTVRRLIRTHQGNLIRERAQLIIVHPRPHRLKVPNSTRSDVRVLEVAPLWLGTTRQRGIPSVEYADGTAPLIAAP